jgi:serine/threonine-protein kinase
LSGVLRFSKKADDEVKKRLPFIAARIVSDAAEGLHAAHEVRGDDGKLLDIVHRDVSPQNIFVTYEGGVSIVDFGIATASDRSAFTAAGQIKGKYAYVAPEQVRAEKVDRRADIWSLGVVLWELLTRKRLFRRANEAETLIAVTSAEIPAPSSVCPEAPPELDAVVLKALSRDREDRFATAREMSREILRALAKTGEMVSMGDVAELMAHAFPGGEERKRQLVSIATAPGRIPKVHTPEADSLTGQEPSSSAVRSVPPKREGGPNVLPWAIVGVLLVALLGVSLVLATGGDDEEVASVDGAPGSTGPGAERPAGGGTEGPASSTMAPEVATDRPATTMAPSIATTQPATTMAATTASTTPTTTARERERERERETREPRTGTMSTTRMSTSGTTMRTEPETSSTPATNATGTVNVVTPGGWAEVWWRGRRVGQTPGRVTIAAGRQRLELRPFGRTPARPVEVTVPADGTTRVSVDLR